MNRTLLLLLLLLPFAAWSQTQETDTVFSRNTNDKYIITVVKPAGYSTGKKYHHVYMTDGSIGIGDYVLGKSKSWAATIPANCIVIAIGHIGNYETKRARDLIPSDISHNATTNFGNANLFYRFLRYELIPAMEKKLAPRKSRAFIGHSFGGLFCLYTLFQDDKLFDHHFAISPSCWANYYELDKIEKAYAAKQKTLKADVMIWAGGLEFLNKVLYSTRSFYTTVAGRNYKGLTIQKDEIGNANHLSIRKPAVDRAFEKLKNL